MNIERVDNSSYQYAEYKSAVKDVAETLPVDDDLVEDEQVMSDEQRELLVGYMGYKSKTDQIDIYLKGSTDGEIGYDGVLSGVVAFNDMQNRMKISDVYA